MSRIQSKKLSKESGKNKLNTGYKCSAGIIGGFVGLQLSGVIIEIAQLFHFALLKFIPWLMIANVIICSVLGVKIAVYTHKMNLQKKTYHTSVPRRILRILATIILSIAFFPLFALTVLSIIRLWSLVTILLILFIVAVWKLVTIEYFSPFFNKRKQPMMQHWKTLNLTRRWSICIIVGITTVGGALISLLSSSNAIGAFGWLFIYGDSESRLRAVSWFLIFFGVTFLIASITSFVRMGIALAMRFTGASIQWKMYGFSLFVSLLSVVYAAMQIFFRHNI